MVEIVVFTKEPDMSDEQGTKYASYSVMLVIRLS